MKVVKWGNSLPVRIPKSVAEALDLKEGSEVDIRPLSEKTAASGSMTREEAILSLRQFRGLMPADFKFDRDEANGR